MPTLAQSRVVVTLGGPGTFAGQATRAFLTRMPGLGPVEYLSTMDEIWAAVSAGAVDSAVLTSETTNTGLDDIGRHLLAPEAALHVNGEILVPYHCMLLGRPGTSLDRIRLVLGHGSLVHCRGFLAERLPQAAVRMHDQNSLAAAAEVLAGDGDTAVVGTVLSAETNGLAVLERDIDRGSVGVWWIMSRELRIAPRPDVLVVGVSSADEGALGDLLGRARRVGLTLRGLTAVGAGSLFRYRYLVVLRSENPSASPQQALAGLTGSRLIGAFESIS
ncbi:MAG: prephenate dehydratase domain-containing protein [Streptosporangiaceae bacterium]